MTVGSKSGKELMSNELLEEESFTHLAASQKVLVHALLAADMLYLMS
jgi:hypothetical protein